MSVIINPIEQYFDLNGDPLENGYLSFGEVYGNPETQPVMVYFDPEFTIPAAQPVRTVNGYPVRSGTATGLYSPQDVSILVRNNKKEQVIYIQSSSIGVDPNTTVYRDTDVVLTADDNNKTFVILQPITQTFDAAVTLGDRWRVNIFNFSSGVVTLDPNLSETIDGLSTLQLQPNQMLTVYCDGVNLKTTTMIYPMQTLASAASVDLRPVRSKLVTISGVASITSIPMINGDRVYAIASGAFTLVHSTNLQVQGSVNYQARVGDLITLVSDGTITRAFISKFDGGATANTFSINGLIMSTAGASTTITVGRGAATGQDGVIMQLAAALAKTTGAWAVGSGNGGLDTGSIANNTAYHVYLIERPDTGVKDIIFSLNAATPALPANYTRYRRIGAWITNASAQWISMKQDGDRFTKLSPTVIDINVTNPGTAAVLRTLPVPLGIKLISILNAGVVRGTGNVTELRLTDPDISASSALPELTGDNASALTYNGDQFFIITNTSGQVRTQLSTSVADTVLRITVMGWIDSRGKE